MKPFICWLKFDSDEEDGRTVRAVDAQHAAQIACDEWNSGGTFSGDPIPDPISVHVRDPETRELFLVEVGHEYDVSFYAGPAKAAAEPE